MRTLNLTRANHCVVVPATPDYLGVVAKAKDYITFGSVDAQTTERLIRERGRLVGDRPVTDEHVKEHTDYGGIAEFAQAIADGQARYKDLPDVKPLFRLSPPKQGFKGSVKRAFHAHGALGNRGDSMADLIGRMM